MSVVSIAVNSAHANVWAGQDYDPASNVASPATTPASYYFPGSAISPPLPASGAPYTLVISPANYHLTGTVVDGKGNIQRFIMQDGGSGDS